MLQSSAPGVSVFFELARGRGLPPAGSGPQGGPQTSLLELYGPIAIFFAIAIIFPLATLWLAKFVRPKFVPTPEKVMPYECGITPESDARGRTTVRFYIIALLFVIFDVETIFLFPWAVQYEVLGVFGFVEMLVFLGILVIGYVWLWKRGALEWI